MISKISVEDRNLNSRYTCVPKKSMETKMQNWRMWSVNNFVDGLTPLILKACPIDVGFTSLSFCLASLAIFLILS